MYAIIKETPSKREILGPFSTEEKAFTFLYSKQFKKYKYQKYYVRELINPNDVL